MMQYPAAKFFHESPDLVAEPIVPQGTLIPVDDESNNHAAGVVKIGPENELCVTLASCSTWHHKRNSILTGTSELAASSR